MKKALLVLLFTTHFAFANNPENLTASTEPKYKISDMDMKILIRQLNNIEQCIYPDLAKPDYQKIYDSWTTVESFTMQYFEQRILQELLGEQHFKLMKEDKPSMDYFNSLHGKLNHQKANVDKERCEAFKPNYEHVYKQIKSALSKNHK